MCFYFCSPHSTLFRLLSRLYDPDGGTVRIGGVDVRELELATLRGQIVGVVPQEPVILSGTIAENIMLGARRGDYTRADDHVRVGEDWQGGDDGSDLDVERLRCDVEHAAEAAGLAPLLARLPMGLDTAIGEGVQMSGGEKQRVAIARLVLSEAPVVLLDEFTSALDERTRSEIINNLRPVLEGRTVICIAHQARVLQDLGITRTVNISK